MNSAYVIFGGAGFVGIHTAIFLIEHGYQGTIYIGDIKSPEEHSAYRFLNKYAVEGRVKYLKIDVRKDIEVEQFSSLNIERIYNFAAVHREPGHERQEYFETNIIGARNVCTFSERVGCNRVIFTSSISPYGPSENEVFENSLTCPETAYGSSKLVAEYIHKLWVEKDVARKLLVLRPGVIFGPGEGGNVTRLVRMITRFGIFFRIGDRGIRKSGIYVKELCAATAWLHEKLEVSGLNHLTSNMTFDPGPTLDEYVAAVSQVAERRCSVVPVPTVLLMGAARLISVLLHGTSLAEQLDPMRVRKITRSNNVRAGFLTSSGYKYKYDLLTAFSDWKVDMPTDWQK